MSRADADEGRLVLTGKRRRGEMTGGAAESVGHMQSRCRRHSHSEEESFTAASALDDEAVPESVIAGGAGVTTRAVSAKTIKPTVVIDGEALDGEGLPPEFCVHMEALSVVEAKPGCSTTYGFFPITAGEGKEKDTARDEAIGPPVPMIQPKASKAGKP